MSNLRKRKKAVVEGAPPAARSEEFRVNYLIHDVSRLRRLLFDQEMRPYGVTHVQWTTLAQLSRSSRKSMTQADLARLLGVGKVATSRMVDRLEAAGLVTRGTDTADRRVNLIVITPKASEILAQMTKVSRQINKQLQEGLTEAQVRAMEHALATIKRNARSLLKDEDATDAD